MIQFRKKEIGALISMVKLKDGLVEILAQYFHDKYKSYKISEAMKRYGLQPDETLNPFDSKRIFASTALEKLSDKEIRQLAARIAKEEGDISLNKQLESFLEDSYFDFTFITRRKLAECLDKCPNFEGKVRLEELLRGIFDLDAFFDPDLDDFFQKRRTVWDYILQHAVYNDDISYKEMLLDVLDFKYISDTALIKFLEKMVHPEVRTGDEQLQYVSCINDVIMADGFELAVSGKISNELIYKVVRKQILPNGMKNLIFASLGEKPDIVIEDAIDNELRIVGNVDNCLLYDFNPAQEGLMWSDLVQWWEPRATSENIQKDLFNRLRKSLDSKVEDNFFKWYYIVYENRENYPALIPQVYLHYDPHAKSWRGNTAIYTHQRMDFLMLLPNGVRLVFEIDGKQHYSEDDKPSPELYAKMALDTRELLLKGYEVYRFGGYELMREETAKELITNFFDRLFEKYGIQLGIK